MRSDTSPTSRTTFCVTYWLSPVMMTTETPFCFSASRTKRPPLGRVKQGGESGQSHVVFGCQRVDVLLVHLAHGDPKSAVPTSAQTLEGLRRLSPQACVERLRSAIDDHRRQIAKTLSASPLVMRRHSSPRRTTTERRLRLKSKGISSTFSYSPTEGVGVSRSQRPGGS